MDDRNNHGQTPLHTTAEKGSTEVVRLYIQMGADIMAQDNDGRTPLHLAAGNGHGLAVEALLMLAQEVWSIPSFSLLTSEKRINVEKQKESSEAVRVRDKHGRTALHWAAGKEGNEEVVRMLVETVAEINACDCEERTALPQTTAILEWGVKNDHYQMVQLLLDQGGDGGPDCPQRMLGLAVDNRSMGTLVCLLERHYRNLKTANGQRALLLIVAEATTSELLGLLRRDTDATAGYIAGGEFANAEHMGKTALSVAMEKNSWRKVSDLMTFGADVNVRINGQTLLLLVLDRFHWMRKNGLGCDCGKDYCALLCHDLRIKSLVEDIAYRLVSPTGEAINEVNEDGKAALHLAVEESLWSVVTKLVQYNANTEVADSEGLMPKDLVEVKDKQEYERAVEWGRHQRVARMKLGLM